MITTLKAFSVWFCILALAVANGALRESVFLPAMGVPAAFIVSGVLLCVLIIGITYLSLPWLKIRRPAHFWCVGLGWVALTLFFEFSLGLLQGKSWGVMLEAYRFKDGNIWPIVLVVTALAPYMAARSKGLVTRVSTV